jgi:hypothetical protein
MASERTFGLFLALLLILQFTAGNLHASRDNAIDVFPWMIGALLIPIILWPAIRMVGARRGVSRLSVDAARRIGSSVAAYSAVIFGLFAGACSWFYASRPRLSLSLIVLALTGLTTWGIGVLSATVWAPLIVRRLREDIVGHGQS